MRHEAQVAVRTIDLNDALHAGQLERLLQVYATDPMGGGRALSADSLARLVPGLRRVPGYRGALAWSGAAAVGLLNGFLGFSTFAARPLFNVHDIVVDAAWRGHGVGRALLHWAEEEARRAGCCKLTLEVLAHNQRAQAVYRRAGYAPYALDPAAGSAGLMQKLLD